VAQRKAREIPLSEITLRKYEQPRDLSERELVRKLCLSLGLLQPGDSRDVIVDVTLVLLQATEPLTARDIEKRVIESREAAKAPVFGVAPSNIRRQILRLRELFIIEKVSNTYRLRENQTLETIFDEHLERYYLASITKRIREYLHAVDTHFKKG
jgi:DNA-binding transcriptional ArsR family regulator